MSRLRLCLVVLALAAPLGAAHAQPAAPPPPAAAEPPKADAEGFEPVKPGEQLGSGETLPASWLVAGAYGFILAVLVGWVGSVAIRSRKLEEEMASLRARIEGKG
jgi:hypothetical protein